MVRAGGKKPGGSGAISRDGVCCGWFCCEILVVYVSEDGYGVILKIERRYEQVLVVVFSLVFFPFSSILFGRGDANDSS
jgi:hypothetical protein